MKPDKEIGGRKHIGVPFEKRSGKGGLKTVSAWSAENSSGGTVSPGEPEQYLGEADIYGMPDGRGRLVFPDKTVYKGSVDWNSQRGSGIWYYPDGSSMTGGFTLCRETPVFKYRYPSGEEKMRFMSRFMSDGNETDTEADGICLELKKRFEREGVEIEYNARALLCDLILSEELFRDRALPVPGFRGIFRINHVFRFFCPGND